MDYKVVCLRLLFLLHFVEVYFCENSIRVEDRTNVDNLAEELNTYITNIIKTKSKRANLVHFVLPTQRDNVKMAQMIDKTLQKISNFWTVTSNDSFCCDSLGEWHIPYENKCLEYIQDVYVIPIYQEKNIEFIEAQIEIMSREDSFNPKAIFILVQLTDQFNEINKSDTQYARIFNNLWKFNIFNATILIISSTDLTLNIVTAKAFSQKNQCRTVQEKGLKYYYLSRENKTTNYNMFLNEKVGNYRGCVFWAGTIPYPPYVIGEVDKVRNETQFTDARGIDIEIIRTLSEKVNLTVKFYQTHTFDMDAWVTILKNGTIIGFVQDLLQRKIDITFGGVMPSYVTSYKLDFSSSYKFSTLNFFVADANILPSWLIFLKVFSIKVWILSAVVFVLVTLVYHLMSVHSLKGIDMSLLELFKLSIGFSSTLNPKTTYVRVLFFSWAVYCVHWYIAYSTMMYLLITGPPHEKEISTFNDLKKSGLEVSVNAIYLEVFGHIEIDKTTTRVLEKHIVCPHIDKCVAQFVKHRNFSVMGTAETLEFLINWQQSKIHKLPENVITFSVSFLLTKGSPLNEELSAVIQRSLQGGLLLKWERDVGRRYRLRNIANEPETKETILDLRGAFYILFIGLIVAILLFIIEVIVDLFIKSKTRPSEINVL